jgi:hypothetical protein
MRRALLFLAILLSFGVVVEAQSSGLPLPPDLDQEKARLVSLNDELRNYANLHDTYIDLAAVGNEASVPLLLERLRKDYGAGERYPPSGSELGFDCAQVHLIDALRSITNTDQGVFYPRWEAWWKANQGLPRHRWILDGFRARGLPAAEPVDERFGLALMDEMGRYDDFRALNAERLLGQLPKEQRVQLVAQASSSQARFLLLGAIKVLGRIADDGQENILRQLASDSDLEIRRKALTVLNDHLRDSFSPSPALPVTLGSIDWSNSVRNLCFLGDLLVAVSNDGEVRAFDIHTLRTAWTRRVFAGAAYQLAAVGDYVFIANREGELVSLDMRGNVVWQKEATGNPDEIRRILWSPDGLLLIRIHSLERLDPETGATKLKLIPSGSILDADATGSHGFFVDEYGLHPIQDNLTKKYSISNALGVSVGDASVCVTSSDITAGNVTCFASDTVSPQWSRPIAPNGTWGHAVAPVRDGTRLLVSTDEDLTAFDAGDGKLEWTSKGGQEAQDTIVPTEFGLLIRNNRYTLELRSPTTGEVLRLWPQIHGVAQLAVKSPFVVVTNFDGAIWLVNLKD